MIKEATKKLSKSEDLERSQMYLVMQEIMTGAAQTPEIVDFLKALNAKGETVEELTVSVEVLRRYVTKIHTDKGVVLDTCGTGGDKSGTFNISTAVAFVAAACGITVAKHGNRSVSSCCGSADILEELGVNINIGKQNLEKCLNEIGIAFLFAQSLHPAMKYAMAARKEIGAKTIFNILGPLSNPAGATHQLVGVYDGRWTEPLAKVLSNLGTVHALVVHGEDGLDEITTTGNTQVSEVNNGKLNSYKINPQELGFKKSRPEDLLGGSVSVNAEILLDILKGGAGLRRDIVVLNAAAAVYVVDRTESIKEGIRIASRAIDSGEALKKLELLKEYSNKV